MREFQSFIGLFVNDRPDEVEEVSTEAYHVKTELGKEDLCLLTDGSVDLCSIQSDALGRYPFRNQIVSRTQIIQ